jgi:hypothetical protein
LLLTKEQKLEKLHREFPELIDNKYNDCLNDLRVMIASWYSNKTSNLNAYSMHYYTELGDLKNCEDERQANGSYTQIGI